MLNSYDYTLLSKIYKQEQNNIMLTRLKNAKSIVKTNCPNSFSNSKKKIIRSQEKKNFSKEKLYN